MEILIEETFRQCNLLHIVGVLIVIMISMCISFLIDLKYRDPKYGTVIGVALAVIGSLTFMLLTTNETQRIHAIVSDWEYVHSHSWEIIEHKGSVYILEREK